MSRYKKQAPPLRAGLIDTAGDCNLAPAAALRTNPKDSGNAQLGNANNSMMLTDGYHVKINIEKRKRNASRYIREVFFRNGFNVINPFSFPVLADIGQVEPVKGNGVHYIAFYPMHGGIVWDRQRLSQMQQIMPFLQYRRLSRTQWNNSAEIIRIRGKHDNGASFIYFRRNRALEVTNQNSTRLGIISNCHCFNRLSVRLILPSRRRL